MFAQPVLFLCAVAGGPAAHTVSPTPPATSAPSVTDAPTVPGVPTASPNTSLPSTAPSSSPVGAPTVSPIIPTVTLWVGCNFSELIMPDTYVRVSGDGCAGVELVPPNGTCELKLSAEVCDSPQCSGLGDGTWDYTDPLCVHFNHPVTAYVDFVVGVAIDKLDNAKKTELAKVLSEAVGLPEGSAAPKGAQAVARTMVSSLVRIPIQDQLGQKRMTPRMLAEHFRQKLIDDIQSPSGVLQAAGFTVEAATLHSVPAGISSTPVPTDPSQAGKGGSTAAPTEEDDSSNPLMLMIIIAASLITCTCLILFLALKRRQRRGLERIKREQELDSVRRQHEDKERRRASLAVSLVESAPSSPRNLNTDATFGGVGDDSMILVTSPLAVNGTESTNSFDNRAPTRGSLRTASGAGGGGGGLSSVGGFHSGMSSVNRAGRGVSSPKGLSPLASSKRASLRPGELPLRSSLRQGGRSASPPSRSPGMSPTAAATTPTVGFSSAEPAAEQQGWC
eukprot:Hpha_TRINITY_DN18511_c0_g1::TRINITY_DN18511_c0_g1_i1::g.195303::m.195303